MDTDDIIIELEKSLKKHKDYNKIQKKLRSDTPIVDYEKDDIEYIEKPLGMANFKNRVADEYDSKPKKVKAHPKDLIECKFCKCWITRANMCVHRRTKKHQLQIQINNKLRDLLVD